jgi:hypothetical protein
MFLNFLQSAFAKPARMLLAASLSAGLVACGGGGGSPGDTSNGTNPGTGTGTIKPVASISLAASAETMSASGADGTEVTLTAIAKDANNNALPNVTISFTASSGSVSSTNRVTDASGTVVEKLSTKGDASARVITVTASSGTAVSAAKSITVIANASPVPKLSLTSSSGTLLSSGVPGSAVQIRALVLDVNNVVVPGIAVNFATDSGSLSASQKLTDASGVATVNLETAADASNRTITVTATANSATSKVTVNVVGTTLQLNAPLTVNTGAKVDLSALLSDSSGAPLANRPVTFTATSGTLTTKAGGASPAVTDGAGKLVLSYGGTANGPATITVSSMGETATTVLTTVSSTFSVGVVTGTAPNFVPQTGALTDVCSKVLVHDFTDTGPRVGTVNVSTSRGAIYTDNTCTALQSGPVALVGGEVVVYIKANSPGIATLTANSNGGLTSVQGTVEFTAPLTAAATISVQATPANIGANAAGSSTQQSVIRAVVLDRAVNGNPVKNARVAFTLLSDTSGGSLSQPSEVMTASDGSASVSFIAGTNTTGANGVVIQAQVLGGNVTSASSTAKLTVSQRSLFITAGTGNTILTPNSTTYQVDYAVFVTDAAGNPVPGVNVTASARPRSYSKGTYVFNGTLFTPVFSALNCLNEDADSNGVLTTDEDFNHNGRLDPGISLNITPTATTSTNGTATISLVYPRDRANWIDVDFIIRGAVSGSESSYLGYVRLKGAVSDFNQAGTAPPGSPSPYGISNRCDDTL